MNQVARAWGFLSIASITLIGIGHHFGGRNGLLLALIGVLAANSLIYFYEDRRILHQFLGQVVEGQDPFGLNETVRRLSVKARIAPPRIVIVADTAPQAAALGRNVSSGTLILTEGLIRKLTPAELEAVLAYQIASIRTSNTLAFAVGSFVSAGLLGLGETLDVFLRILIVEKKNENMPVTQIFTRLLTPMIGAVLSLSVRQSAYLAADDLASHLLGDSKPLASALWKLNCFSNTQPFATSIASAHIFIVSPLNPKKWARRAAAQPQIETRIRRLIGYYPI